MSFQAKTDGKDRKFFRAAQRRVRESMGPMARTAMGVLKSNIADTAPRESGRLATSFAIADATNEGGRLESDLPYAGVQERRFGYIARAVEKSKRKIEAEAKKSTVNALQKAKRDAGG